MPFGDGTGPMGEGPMTGRAMGRCAGRARAAYHAGYGRGHRRGFGYGNGGAHGRGFGGGYGRAYGRGYGWRYGAALDPWTWTSEQEMDALRQQADYFEAQARELRQRMDSLEQEQAASSAKEE